MPIEEASFTIANEEDDECQYAVDLARGTVTLRGPHNWEGDISSPNEMEFPIDHLETVQVVLDKLGKLRED